ncbi:MAG TPA: YraN family protein [Candidatus Woesebacteria bacterium]|nr:YraN family protein [Candidatus Woesebacteria bacterium]HPJ16925.1 YraN family protein [Candidatus Woesebacteria bacterium]
MKQDNYLKGKEGEEIALKFLESKRFELIEKNYKNDIGEIDLIMKDRDWLVFVEVKYKLDDSLGNPEEMINYKKLGKIKRIATLYLMTNHKFQHYRIDAVCILKTTINYYQNIG